MALPTALFAMIASVALAGAAVMSSVDVQQGSHRDSGSKSAIGAADAGANVAMMRLARDSSELGTSPCLSGSTAEANGWCSPIAGEVGGSTYSYQISQATSTCGEFSLCLVATGSTGDVIRRVLVTFNRGSSTGTSGKTKEQEEKEKAGGSSSGGGGPDGLIGKESITFSGNAEVFHVNVGTDGNVTTSGSYNVCGNIRHGIGKTIIGPVHQCPGYQVTEGNLTLPPVSSFMPADIATHNSNARITACSKGLPAECQKDTFTGKWNSTSPLNPNPRRVSLSGNDTLTLGGGDYWLCELSMSGSTELIMAAGSHVRIFFDTPKNCETSSPINISGNVKIKATGYNKDTKTFDMPGFFITGSTSTATSLTLSGNTGSTEEFVVYAPNTSITVTGNATYKGVIAGKTVTMTGSSHLEHDAGFELQPGLNPWFEEESKAKQGGGGSEPTAGTVVFTPQYYRECVGPAGPLPNSNC
ncbi:MAG TPA: hypothetical protein VHQ43_08905 [Solirubrobacterales bacterium]|jgi:hypothetical protein|nr:hypothetical protein [Solirubrobacterales bacterium]